MYLNASAESMPKDYIAPFEVGYEMAAFRLRNKCFTCHIDLP